MSHSFFIFLFRTLFFLSEGIPFFSKLRFCRSPSSFSYLPLYVVVALAEVVWEPPLTLAPRVSPYQVSLVSVMVGEV